MTPPEIPRPTGNATGAAARLVPRMDARVPGSVQPALRAYLDRVQHELPGLLVGFYLYGSIAYGSYEEAASDVDCLVVIARPCGPDDLSRLRAIHRDIAAQWPRCDLELSYVPLSECGPYRPGGTPQPVFHEGVFHDHSDAALASPIWSSILWWQIRKRGIAVLGPEVAALGFEVSAAELLRDNRCLVEEYWQRWTTVPSRMLDLRDARAIDWVVTGILRSYYTLREADVTTKAGAAEYGMAHLPARWHRFIRETLEVRRNRTARGLPFRLRRAIQAVLFLRFMVAECRRVAGGES